MRSQVDLASSIHSAVERNARNTTFTSLGLQSFMYLFLLHSTQWTTQWPAVTTYLELIRVPRHRGWARLRISTSQGYLSLSLSGAAGVFSRPHLLQSPESASTSSSSTETENSTLAFRTENSSFIYHQCTPCYLRRKRENVNLFNFCIFTNPPMWTMN